MSINPNSKTLLEIIESAEEGFRMLSHLPDATELCKAKSAELLIAKSRLEWRRQCATPLTEPLAVGSR